MNEDTHFELAVALSRDALRGLLLVNGGAATALVALMDKSNNNHDYTSSILWFGAGTVGAVISTCFAYFSQLNYANSVLRSGHPVTLRKSFISHKLHGFWQVAAIISVAATLICTVVGMWTAAHIASH
jgi:hypothetical protein